jgi:hypothetical protein
VYSGTLTGTTVATRGGATDRGGQWLSVGDNGKSHDCKRRQDSSSMYAHGILASPPLALGPNMVETPAELPFIGDQVDISAQHFWTGGLETAGPFVTMRL